MAKDFSIAMLLDFYGGLLTEKQFFALDMYYNQDLSLSETAAEMNISRQGVQAFLKQGEKHLHNYEETLGLAKRFDRINSKIEQMKLVISNMPQSEESIKLRSLIETVSKDL